MADAPRLGTSATYSAEDACAILALACEDPCDSGRAITHWTQRKLAAEAIKRGTVVSAKTKNVAQASRLRYVDSA